MKTIPIDYDRPMYEDARRRCGGTDEKTFEAFFDEQYEMLQALKPPIVGHFDLIRLKSDQPDCSMKSWDDVWKRVLRNLEFIQRYGGLIELNSAALRKGLSEPYPQSDICKVCSFTKLLSGWFESNSIWRADILGNGWPFYAF